MTDDTNYEGVAAYSSDEDEEIIPEIDDENKQTKRNDTYSTIHSSGFKDFLLKSALVRAIIDCAFEHPSEVQNQCLPSAITGSDILCQAQSGMGKTAVFVLAVLQQMEENPEGVRCLVLCHARELAYQICHEFDRFTKYMPNIKTAVFYGGIQYDENVEIIKNENPNIVVGTPGRILQLVKSKDLNLSRCKFFVLDECDKMLEKTDMRSDVQSIFRDTPHEKQVMMFSATLSEAVRPVCRKFMHKPLEIIINDGSKLTLHGLKQYYVQLDEAAKTKQLIKLLDDLEFNQCIIFVRTVRRATELNAILVELKFPSICIHGGREMTQEERIRRYKKFKEFRVRIMVATNLFGRGIDIERVNVVINYDMSEDYETYLHRVGRAGRFGTNGLAISFISSKEDADVLNSVQKVFVVNVPKLPDVIDPTTYMNS